MWFLWALMIFFAVLRWAVRFSDRTHLRVAALSSVLAFAVGGIPFVQTFLSETGFDQLLAPFQFYVFFAGACLMSTGLSGLQRYVRPRNVAAVVVLWLGLSLLLNIFRPAMMIPGVGMVWRLVGVAVGISISVGLARVVPGVARLGPRTLEIYVAHSVVIIGLAVLVEASGVGDSVHGQAIPTIVVLLTAAVATAISLAIGGRAERWHVGWLYRPPNRSS
jgi:hypothetical protein